jgi:hypothetical protein
MLDGMTPMTPGRRHAKIPIVVHDIIGAVALESEISRDGKRSMILVEFDAGMALLLLRWAL